MAVPSVCVTLEVQTCEASLDCTIVSIILGRQLDREYVLTDLLTEYMNVSKWRQRRSKQAEERTKHRTQMTGYQAHASMVPSSVSLPVECVVSMTNPQQVVLFPAVLGIDTYAALPVHVFQA